MPPLKIEDYEDAGVPAETKHSLVVRCIVAFDNKVHIWPAEEHQGTINNWLGVSGTWTNCQNENVMRTRSY